MQNWKSAMSPEAGIFDSAGGPTQKLPFGAKYCCSSQTLIVIVQFDDQQNPTLDLFPESPNDEEQSPKWTGDLKLAKNL